MLLSLRRTDLFQISSTPEGFTLAIRLKNRVYEGAHEVQICSVIGLRYRVNCEEVQRLHARSVFVRRKERPTNDKS